MNKFFQYRLAGLVLVSFALVLVLKNIPARSAGGLPAQAPADTDRAAAQAVENQGENKPAAAAQAAAAPANQAAAAVPDPVALLINSANLSVPVVKTGLEEDGSLHVPGPAGLAGWYVNGPRPGEVGPAVITGHYDSKLGPGGLFNLKNVKAGDEARVVRNDGSTAVFRVDSLKYYPQDDFGTQEVYGAINTAGLRIITCAGIYNRKTQRYSDNLVVFATLQEVVQPADYVAR